MTPMRASLDAGAVDAARAGAISRARRGGEEDAGPATGAPCGQSKNSSEFPFLAVFG
jgi:hypothetical protein